MDITIMRVNRNRTFYYIKEGISSIFNHSLMSFASICIIVAFLIIMGSFILLAVNINAIIGELENDNIILAYIHENVPESEARAIEHTLRSIPNIASVVFIPREEAFENFMRRYDEEDRFADIDYTVFRHRYAIYVEDVALIEDTQQELRYIPELASNSANLAIAQTLVNIRNVVSWISIIIIAVLLAISLFIMSNTIKLATYERREEIAIMKMVGATNSFIRWPFIFEGFILGITGSLVAYLSIIGLYSLTAGWVLDFEAGFFQLVVFSNVSVPLFLLFTAIGFGVGVGGSVFALNRYLNV
ncbi:MAG: permease-like cell division protein FtsX [Oscillospiraceae bacterium]|nr:permease-like cell division protein FtsX [Oscillospiraceae bacterium]